MCVGGSHHWILQPVPAGRQRRYPRVWEVKGQALLELESNGLRQKPSFTLMVTQWKLCEVRFCTGSSSLCLVIPWGLQEILQEESHSVQMQIQGCSPCTLHSHLPSILGCFPSCHWDIISLCSPTRAWSTQNSPKRSWTSWQSFLPETSKCWIACVLYYLWLPWKLSNGPNLFLGCSWPLYSAS